MRDQALEAVDWMTETAQWCSTCDQNGTPSQGEWGFAKEGNDIFLQDVVNGFPTVLVWEAYDGFYYHHNSYSTWGLLAYNTTTGVYTPRKRFYVNAQLTGFIRPGAKRVSVSTSVSGLTALAFYDAAKGEVAIVGHNSGSSPASVSGRFTNLPVAVSALALYTADVVALARKDLKLELRARDTLPAMLLFVLSTLVVFR